MPKKKSTYWEAVLIGVIALLGGIIFLTQMHQYLVYLDLQQAGVDHANVVLKSTHPEAWVVPGQTERIASQYESLVGFPDNTFKMCTFKQYNDVFIECQDTSP